MALCFHHAWVSWKVSFLFFLNVLIVIISDFVVLTILSLHRVFYFEINLLLAILVSVFLPGSICSSQHDLNSVKNILCVFSPHSRAASGQLLKHLLWAKWTHEHCLEWLRSAPAAMQPYHNIDISCKTWVQVYYHYRLFCSLFNFFFPFFHFKSQWWHLQMSRIVWTTLQKRGPRGKLLIQLFQIISLSVDESVNICSSIPNTRGMPFSTLQALDTLTSASTAAKL